MTPTPAELQIITEQPGHVASISALHRAAFANNPYSDQTESSIVERLRARGKLALSLVAVLPSGQVAGHVAFSPVQVDGADLRWFGLGPVGVLPGYQHQGIGTRLIEEGLAILRAKGAQACVVLGEPEYYGRFGFRADARLRYPGPPAEYFMCLALDSSPTPEGVVSYDSAFG